MEGGRLVGCIVSRPATTNWTWTVSWYRILVSTMLTKNSSSDAQSEYPFPSPDRCDVFGATLDDTGILRSTYYTGS